MPPVRTPETTHSIVIGDATIVYQLRRTSRRSIGLTVDHRGLRVGASPRATLGDIEALIRQHGQWVLDKLAAWRERTAPEPLTVTDGLTISVLGQPLLITVTPIGRARWQSVGDKLHLWPSATVDPNILLKKALQEIARKTFAERLEHYAPQLGVPSPPLRLSSARTRWGSCNHRGDIALNWRLVLMPLDIVDYVVCHELAHLREMNHSPRFWSVVEQLCPDWRALRLALRNYSHQIPQIQ